MLVYVYKNVEWSLLFGMLINNKVNKEFLFLFNFVMRVFRGFKVI